MTQNVLTITELSAYLKTMMDRDDLLSSIAVRGEISNYKVYPSGHHYFTLKDENSALKCVMFRGSAMSLRFRPANGMKVIAMGRITVYPRDGVYQLYCSALMVDGVGDLHAAFEQLKEKLSKQGLFDPAHKKPIPRYPGVIGIITSSAGAAIHDMLRILARRYPITQVKLLPVRVQGAEAPEEIAAAIRYANAHRLADVLIVGRGGGSIEDLWAFNDERVAYAIYESRIPVISAVGHEPDVTISDYVADVRAATPSNAAELAVPDREALSQQLDGFCSAMISNLSGKIQSARRQLGAFSASAALQSPESYLKLRRRDLSYLQDRLSSAQLRLIQGQKQSFIAAAAKLDALSPLKVLTRGYAVVSGENGSLIRSAAQAEIGQTVNIRLNDGSFQAVVSQKEVAP